MQQHQIGEEDSDCIISFFITLTKILAKNCNEVFEFVKVKY